MSFITSLKLFANTVFGVKKKKSKIIVREVDVKNASQKPRAIPIRKDEKAPPPKSEQSKSKQIPKNISKKDASDDLGVPPSPRRKTGGKSESKARTKKTGKQPSALIEDFTPEPWDYTVCLPPEQEGKIRFHEFELSACVLRGVHDIAFQYCTDIQAAILPHSVKGLDVTGRAQTGTGKTAAFLLTILEHLIRKKPPKQRKCGAPRALIMAPTRELVMQIEKDAIALSKYCRARIIAVFGGIDYEKQRVALEENYVDIVIATPGRILDYYKQDIVRLDRVEILVLDEADRMLDMGFLPDMRRIIDATPQKSERQTMLFSATLTQEITRLISRWTNNPIKVEIEPEQITAAAVEQTAYIVSEQEKFPLLHNLLKKWRIRRALIFANRRDQVRKLTELLEACDFACGMLTGDMNQIKRIKTLENLKNGNINILVATDVAGRGIHIEGVEAVFNYTLPDDPDDYVHRIGRTGRAGAKGRSVSFASEEDAYVLPQIEAHIKEPLKYITPNEELLTPIPEEYVIRLKDIKRRRNTLVKHGQSGGFNKRRTGKRR